jgi:hypothetical protein
MPYSKNKEETNSSQKRTVNSAIPKTVLFPGTVDSGDCMAWVYHAEMLGPCTV